MRAVILLALLLCACRGADKTSVGEGSGQRTRGGLNINGNNTPGSGLHSACNTATHCCYDNTAMSDAAKPATCSGTWVGTYPNCKCSSSAKTPVCTTGDSAYQGMSLAAAENDCTSKGGMFDHNDGSCTCEVNTEPRTD